ncbi:Kinesin-like protein [Rhynchospora pubera]|uniref:Kinesin-like protein n=1 Tax=Rhynchospora pubera TaxID=906938 RepID=A0AAV8DI20_9POAL|nr:Kinesin-like protein [Rhynchospora pubera]
MPLSTQSHISVHQSEANVRANSYSSPILRKNPNHELKEKMRSLTAFYEQHKLNQHGARAIGTHHPSVDLLGRNQSKKASSQEGEENQDPTLLPQNRERTVHVFIPRQGKDNTRAYSCPIKRSAGPTTKNVRKLSMGGLEAAPGKAEEGRIFVFVRLRPMSKKEKDAGSRSCVRIVNRKEVYLTEFASENDYLRLKRVQGRHFCFDAAFPDSTDQEEVYATTTSELVERVLQGQNGTVFCYGATGAGKTYTMLGTTENPGVMVLAIKDLFAKIRQRSLDGAHSVSLSYLEVYNETVRDLLSPGRPLVLREDKQGTVAAGLTQYRAFSTDEVMRLLQQGNQNRTTEPTRVNETSSRSHAILQVVAEYKVEDPATKSIITRVGKLSLIDLAGSERALATDQRTLRSIEGANINRSLLALSSCINALVEGKKHIPYRNSKLTQLLKDSLGGACNTVMIANVSPSSISFGETQNTLHWADRAKEIKTKPSNLNGDPFKVPETETDQSKLVLQLQKENSELRQQLMQCQQRLLATQAQSLACNSTSTPAPSPILSSQCASAQKTKRNILLSGTCFTTPDTKRKPLGDENPQLVKELKKKVKDLEAELEKQRKEHLMQLKHKDEFIRGLIAKKGVSEKCMGGGERRVLTRASLRKKVEEVGELKSPVRSHRFVSPIQQQANKKRSFWDIANGNSPSILAINGRKTRSHVTAEVPSAPSMLLQDSVVSVVESSKCC